MREQNLLNLKPYHGFNCELRHFIRIVFLDKLRSGQIEIESWRRRSVVRMTGLPFPRPAYGTR